MDVMGFLTQLWENHRNACIGVVVGLLIGRVIDNGGGWKNFIENFKRNE